MNKWEADNNPFQNRRLGKTGEEVNELGSVLFRISIQGIDAIDPSSGKTNRQRLLEETADVIAQCRCNMKSLFNDGERAFVNLRILEKCQQMAQWEAHYEPRKVDNRIFHAETVAEQQAALTRLMASDSCSTCHGNSDRCDAVKCGGAHR